MSAKGYRVASNLPLTDRQANDLYALLDEIQQKREAFEEISHFIPSDLVVRRLMEKLEHHSMSESGRNYWAKVQENRRIHRQKYGY